MTSNRSGIQHNPQSICADRTTAPVRGARRPMWRFSTGTMSARRSRPINTSTFGQHEHSESGHGRSTAGFNRRYSSKSPVTEGQDWARKLGIPNVSPQSFPRFNIPNITLPTGSSVDVHEGLSFQDNFTYIRGLHTFKMGFESLLTRENTSVTSQVSGTYNFGVRSFRTGPTPATVCQFHAQPVTGATFTQALRRPAALVESSGYFRTIGRSRQS
jgi:hypothetical protein